MSYLSKKLSSPFSTGGGGEHFESHVQASFVVLMLTGGYAPCMPCWPIKEIRLQGKIDGYDTDDLIVVVEKGDTSERRKLLGQIKHSIAITQSSSTFAEVMQAAWNDFNNSTIFSKGKDVIALITRPLSATDTRNVQWLLSQAKHTKNAVEFFRNVEQFNFSPPKSGEKLAVIQHHLKTANRGVEISRDVLHSFLNHFHLLGYDLGKEVGVVLSLLLSHISQFHRQSPRWVWSRVVNIVQTWNQDAGTITRDKLPEDLVEAFKKHVITEIPKELTIVQQVSEKTNWNQNSYATDLALANLVGSWNEKNDADIAVLAKMLGTDYDSWVQKAREILNHPDSLLSLKNGQWKISDREELLNFLGTRVFDQNLDTFKSLAVTVLTERDPSFELPPEDRYAANVHGKVLVHSNLLRKGLVEGLAILGCNPDAFSNCSHKVEDVVVLAIRDIFADADWVLWGSLNSLLPTLAEAAPGEFLNVVESALRLSPCPFDQLFAQEGDGITGGNYLAGLLWALEGLAWDEKYLVRVCVLLGELASHDPGGQWANRPVNSLITILLPWLPQTLASIEKRKVAIQTLNNEWPEIGWKLLVRLLPNQHKSSSGSHKPYWRKTIPDDWEEDVSQQEYRQQVSSYTELAVSCAGNDTGKLAELIDHFDNLPKLAFDHLVDVLSSNEIRNLPEEQRLLIWDHLTKFTTKHRRFSDTEWALSDALLTQIEDVASKLAPSNPFNLYQHLFSDHDFDLYEENGNWEEQRQKLDNRRGTAIKEIFQQGRIDAVIQFAESVLSPGQVGLALGNLSAPSIEQKLFPTFLDSENQKHSTLVSGFIWRRHYINSWEWSDRIDKSSWSDKQTGFFLSYLPFTKECWERVSQWLGESQGEYWSITNANAYQADANLGIAIEKLLEFGRPRAVINCLDRMRYSKQQIDSKQCVRALLAAPSSKELSYGIDGYRITELIKFLQPDTSVSQDDLFRIEWTYLTLLDRHHRGVAPKLLESRLASDPEFFHELIRRIYRSKKPDKQQKESTEEEKADATKALRLLHEWRTPPGVQEDGVFNEAKFSGWLQRVKELCAESGHLEVAHISIGDVLAHSPADTDGLWINRTIAEALNNSDSEDMRDGFRAGIYNARGAHNVDPTGKPEKELATQFKEKAEDVENAGFHRLAITLRGLADGYEQEAERIILEHVDEVLE